MAVARALINRPPLLLADEPTGAVDAQAGANITELLRDLNRGGQTVLLVTHDAALARGAPPGSSRSATASSPRRSA